MAQNASSGVTIDQQLQIARAAGLANCRADYGSFDWQHIDIVARLPLEMARPLVGKKKRLDSRHDWEPNGRDVTTFCQSTNQSICILFPGPHSTHASLVGTSISIVGTGCVLCTDCIVLCYGVSVDKKAMDQHIFVAIQFDVFTMGMGPFHCTRPVLDRRHRNCNHVLNSEMGC